MSRCHAMTNIIIFYSYNKSIIEKRTPTLFIITVTRNDVETPDKRLQ